MILLENSFWEHQVQVRVLFDITQCCVWLEDFEAKLQVLQAGRSTFVIFRILRNIDFDLCGFIAVVHHVFDD